MEYKRKQRALSDVTKQKISMKLKGRRKVLLIVAKSQKAWKITGSRFRNKQHRVQLPQVFNE